MFVIGYNNSDVHYSTDSHCEKPERVSHTIKKLSKVYDKSYFITFPNPNIPRCLELISLVHSKEHLQLLTKPKFNIWYCRNCSKPMYSETKSTFEKFIEVQQKCYFCEVELTTTNICTHIDSDTYFTYGTPQVIFEGIAVIDEIIQQIIGKQIICGFALIRPPGHHCCNKASGFCICNNAVVATRAAQQVGLNKVLILDIDFHHGDGTQKLISDEDLLYRQIKNTRMISIHGFGPGIYPGTGSESESTESESLISFKNSLSFLFLFCFFISSLFIV
jgi:acetoin utilization deacetylase AcuC-like enzyme